MQRDIVKEHKEEGCEDYFLSGCCGEGEHEFVENFCGGCGEFAEFECSVCEQTRDVGKEWEHLKGVKLSEHVGHTDDF